MVTLTTIRPANASLVQSRPLVAVFVGGTSGIGHHTLLALAATHGQNGGKGLRAYIVGRNAGAAHAIIKECEKSCPEGRFLFVKVADLALLGSAEVLCREIERLEREEAGKKGEVPRVDLLVMSMACPPFGPRRDTAEGLPTFISLVYYARMRLTTLLLPLLLSAPNPAHIISIYAGGMEVPSRLHTSDLSLRAPGAYNLSNARSHTCYMSTFFMEKLVAQHPGKLSFSHVFPGLVITNGFDSPELPGWFKWVWKCGGRALAGWFAVPHGEAGERALFLATEGFVAGPRGGSGGGGEVGGGGHSGKAEVAMGSNGERGSGVYAVGQSSDTIVTEKLYEKFREEGVAEKVWKHTMEVFKEVENGRVFKG